MASADTHTTLPADTNQALGLAHFALECMRTERPGPGDAVVERTNLFHTDAVLCGLSALALRTNAPTVLRREALQYPVPEPGRGSMAPPNGAARFGAPVFGGAQDVAVEKAILANASAVREWDSNGTNFGYNPRLGHTAGEFGHNDYYAVPVAAAQMMGRDGAYAMRGMILLDEIRGRLAEVFSLKTYKVDHVLHGAVASAAVFGAMTGATADQIESAIGMVVAHAVPFRAIRHGHQLSDSKGASAAISTEFAVTAAKRSMAGFVGPRDIFRNPEAVYCLFQKPAGKNSSPFELVLARAGDDFAVMGMHFKIGLYEHQSAGALQGLIDLLAKHPRLLEDPRGSRIRRIVVKAYEPAFHIIGDPHKRDPRTRQSADHSMLYLVCTMLRKALEIHAARPGRPLGWPELMLLPHDFDGAGIAHPLTRELMSRMSFEWGGPDYDARYPDGIPTSIIITDDEGTVADSGLVMYPAGHARNTTADLRSLLRTKNARLGALAVGEDRVESLLRRLGAVEALSARDLRSLYDVPLRDHPPFE